MTIRDKFNPKRRLRDPRPDVERREEWLTAAEYTGSPYHKINPGDFGLTPPSAPRADKTPCDNVEIFEKARAQGLLEEGFRRGLVSEQERNGWPQNVWVVTENQEPLEAQLENQMLGTYHGYPMLSHDPLYKQVLEWWEEE